MQNTIPTDVVINPHELRNLKMYLVRNKTTGDTKVIISVNGQVLFISENDLTHGDEGTIERHYTILRQVLPGEAVVLRP